MTKTLPKLARLELQILEILWTCGHASVREIQEGFPEPRPAYTTVQTTVYRLEAKGAVRRTRKIGNAHIFEPLVARESGSPPPARHDPRLLRRPRAADDAAARRGGEADARRRQGSGEDNPKAVSGAGRGKDA